MSCVKLSIIIPFYKGETLIRNLLRSLSESYKQSNKNIVIEIIVIIDSVNSSFNEIENIIFHELFGSELKNNLIIKKNHINLGVSKSRNFGLSISNGEYVTFIDQDDYVSIKYFSVLGEKLNKIHSIYVLNGYIIESKFLKKVPLYYFTPNITLKTLIKRNILYTPGIMIFKKSDLLREPIFDDSFSDKKGVDDWAAYLSIFIKYPVKIYFINEKLFYYCLHQNNFSHDLNTSSEASIELLNTFSKYNELSALINHSKKSIYFKLGLLQSKNKMLFSIKNIDHFFSYLLCNFFDLNILIGFIHKKLINFDCRKL